jgi:amino acid adenylation domain-containing protein
MFFADKQTRLENELVPAGYVVHDTNVTVLNDEGDEVEINTVGEIAVKSRYLAVGYWRQPEETQAAFVPDAEGTDMRLFRTGDLGRIESDGCLVRVDRKGDQVKIRGFRVEPTEIERVLREHESVKEAVVVSRQNDQDEPCLVAYVVPTQPEVARGAQLKDFIASKLPDYMTPSTIVIINQLPLTSSGKLDRRALPEPDERGLPTDETYVAPRMPIERELVEIWADVLGVNRVGIDDSFFELGGHSLLATKLLVRIRNTFQQDVALRTIFEAPTIAELADHLATREQTALPADDLPLIPVPRDGALPLSFAQQRLWFLDQFEPGSTAYLLTRVLRLTGPLNHSALEQSLNSLVARHESLRTTFATVEGTPVQVIAPVLILPLSVVDLQDLSAEEQETAIHQRVQEEASTPFALAVGPLIRTTLLKIGPEEQVFLLTLHHIITDGWSMGILFRELAALYQAACEGQPLDLPPLPIQYVDYTAWQRQWLQGEALEQQLAYWREQLTDLTLLDFPTDHPRPPMLTHHGQRHTFTLSPTLLKGIKAVSQQAGTTLFMTLLAAFHVILARYSGQHDIAVGTPVANRDRQEIEGLIGFFLNTLVLRTDLSGNPPFLRVLHQVREHCLQAYAHQDIPFEKLVEELQPVRDPSRHPLFQVMFQVNHQSADTGFIPGLGCVALARDQIAAKFDLAVALTENPEGLRGTIDFNTDLFEAATVARLSAHFVQLLEAIVQNPDQRISELSLLEEHEHTKLLVEWNRTNRAFPSTQCVHTCFEVQVAQTPDAVAVVCEDDPLTYGELNHRANQLADVLQQQGVGPGTLVGFCVERSLDMLVGLLGILKAGAAYVPLDPTYPSDRLAFMIDDTQMPMIVTHRHLLEQLQLDQPNGTSSSSTPTIVDLDSAEWKEEGLFFANPINAVTPEHLMYVIYTSGSTGHPKGVMIAHRTVGNFLRAMQEELLLTQQDTFLALTSLSFDISILELFGPLLVGGCVHLVSRDTAMDGIALVQALTQSKATLMQATPVTWQLLLDSNWPGSPGLRAVCGGEALAGSLGQALLEKSVTLWNMYGPTETTVWSTLHRVSPDDHTVPIGRPIANTQLYVLDAAQQLVPVGVPGELYIGGEGLSLGYWQREELTREKFIPHPFSDDPQARLYRTGDQVRYRADGTLEFLGRLDDQVKLRGFRIELGEIEATLALHPLVREAVVLVRDDGPGGPYLVGYLLSAHESPISMDELQGFLKERLPKYMVPSAWVELEAFPLTPNGKINRRALPAPLRINTRLEGAFAAPRGPLEEALVEIWQDVLEVDHLGIQDNFFDLGGHSLLGTQIFSRIQRNFSVALPLRHLFETPTVAGVAEKLEVLLRGGQPIEALEVHPAPRDTDLPLSLAQQRLWFLDQLDPDQQAYFITKTCRLRGPLDFQALEQSLNEILKRHESLRTTFAIVDEQIIQCIASTSHLSLPLIDLRETPEDERETEAHRLVTQEVQRPFNLEEGPLFRVAVFRLGTEDHILVITVHHIITDGWSMGVLYRELSLLYNSFTRGEASPLLQDSPVQYADYAVWQRQWLQGERLEKELAYWKSQLTGVSILKLPTDWPRPPLQTNNGAGHSFSLSDHLGKALKTLSKQEGCTFFMTMLAAFQTLLHRYAGQNDIVVGSPIAGRTQKELEGSIGLFINTLVLRTNFSGNPTFREVLRQVREVAFGAYAHQVIPFEELLETLKPERNHSYPPMFQVLFVLQNAPGADLEFSGLTASRYRVKKERAMFDLTLSVSEKSGKLKGGVGYNTDLFNQRTISRMFLHFEILLEGIVTNPDQKVWSLPFLTEPEQHQVLIEWNSPQALPLPEASIQRLFEQQVEQTPAATATFFDGQELSYEEFNARANQLARVLQKQGVGPEVRVGLCLERSLEMVIGLLGILKAGGVYVPLDPTYPQERLGFILHDAQISVLVTHSHLHGQLPSPDGLIRVNLDTDQDVIAKENQTNLNQHVATENLAYIIYTSGSTGIPKGVMITQGSLVNYVETAKNDFQLGPKDRVLQFASISFDASAEEIYPCLTSGGTLVLRTEPMLDSWNEFLAKCQAWQLTVLDLPTAFWHELVAGLAAEGRTLPPSVRLVIIGGERARPERLTQWHDLVSDSVQLVNTYGPTEGTIVATKGELMRASSSSVPEKAEVTLGKVISNVRGYLLDRAGQLVPIRVPGELYLGGIGIARGYVNRSDTTAEKFLPDPFSKDPGARLYRTGDLARYRDDGTLEFVGRMDHQVKLRGYRIELGEIEATLAQHPLVQKATVLLRDDGPGGSHLVGYWLSSHESPISIDELQGFLKERLPEYMVPSAWVELEVFPLTPNGKLDRRALPAPTREHRGVGTMAAVPRSPLEEALVEIWQEVLGIDHVGIHDNFFALGGHSLLATKVVARLRNVFEVDIPLRSLFEYPTIGGFAKEIDKQLPRTFPELPINTSKSS